MSFFNFSASHYFAFNWLFISYYLCLVRKFWEVTKFLFLDRLGSSDSWQNRPTWPVRENLRWIAKEFEKEIDVEQFINSSHSLEVHFIKAVQNLNF